MLGVDDKYEIISRSALACWYPRYGEFHPTFPVTVLSERFRETMVLFSHLECFHAGTQTWKLGIFLSLIIAESFRCESVRADTEFRNDSVYKRGLSPPLPLSLFLFFLSLPYHRVGFRTSRVARKLPTMECCGNSFFLFSFSF